MYIKINGGPYRGITKSEYWDLSKYLWTYHKSSLCKYGDFTYKKVSNIFLKEIKRK